MAGPRSPRDREAAPGDEPGADSFARPGRGKEPQGIVRLSDLIAGQGEGLGTARFDRGGPRSSPGDDGAARWLPITTAAHERDSPRLWPRGDIGNADGRGDHGTPRRLHPADPAPAGRRGASARGRIKAAPRRDAAYVDESEAGGPTSSALASAGPPQWRSGTGAPAADGFASAVEASGDTESLGQGPAYESLFDAGDAKRGRTRRERQPASALQRALGLLTRREHSRKELTRKLIARGVDAGEVETAVGKLTTAGWQDDRRFAESLVRSRAANGYGPLHIRAELGTHDLSSDIRQAVLDEFEGDWTEIARDLAMRRFARVDDPRVRERKAVDFLIRRGFPADVARAAARFPSGD